MLMEHVQMKMILADAEIVVVKDVKLKRQLQAAQAHITERMLR